VYGPDVALPAQATVYFQGVDKHAGPLTKYFLLSRDVHP
jgi:hypothetical protein